MSRARLPGYIATSRNAAGNRTCCFCSDTAPARCSSRSWAPTPSSWRAAISPARSCAESCPWVPSCGTTTCAVDREERSRSRGGGVCA
jgi:hypothetical protein